MQSSAALLGLCFPAPARPPTTSVILAWHDISVAARSCLAVTGSVQCRLDCLFCETLSGVLKGELYAVAWLLGNCTRASAVAAIALVGGPASVTVSCPGGYTRACRLAHLGCRDAP